MKDKTDIVISLECQYIVIVIKCSLSLSLSLLMADGESSI